MSVVKGIRSVLNARSFAKEPTMIASGIDSFEVARMPGTSTEMIDKHYGHLRHDWMRAKLDAISII
jgi:hypothetical protein